MSKTNRKKRLELWDRKHVLRQQIEDIEQQIQDVDKEMSRLDTEDLVISHMKDADDAIGSDSASMTMNDALTSFNEYVTRANKSICWNRDEDAYYSYVYVEDDKGKHIFERTADRQEDIQPTRREWEAMKRLKYTLRINPYCQGTKVYGM